MPYSDIVKQREAQRLFIRNKKLKFPYWNNELKKSLKIKREAVHEIVNYIKKTIGCLTCDEKDPRKLQFHHVIPELKVDTVSALISNRSKLVVVMKEIDKCVCVCTACHSTLQKNLEYVKNTIRNEKWYKDWGLHEAMDWSRFHPQSRINKSNIMEIIKAVARNSQFDDVKKFKKLFLE